MGRAFTQTEVLTKLIEDGWYCQVTGVPLIFPATLCLLERLTSCGGGRNSGPGFGYYDLRETMATAPLLTLSYPAADHRFAHANGGATSSDNLSMVTGLVNGTKSNVELEVVDPSSPGSRSKGKKAIIYWPPSRHYPRKGDGTKDWDGMLGVFLRLYRPDLPELAVDWGFREHRGDARYLAGWYHTVFKVLSKNLELQERYEHLKGVAFWPSPPPKQPKKPTPNA